MASSRWQVAGLLNIFWLMGCTAVNPPPTPIQPSASTFASTTSPLPTPSPADPITSTSATSSPDPSAISSSPTPPALPPDSGWQTLHPGLEQRMIRLFDKDGEPEAASGEATSGEATSGRVREEISIFRIDPAQYEFQVAYHPGAPQTLAEWQAETGALLVVNGGFFTEEFTATGLTVVAGQPSGTSYEGFGGMLAVTEAGPEVRPLEERPYLPDEPLAYALQSFPMLLKPGGQIGYPEEDGQSGRRTVIGQDGDGRVFFILAPWGSFTLHEMSVWLAESDLNLDVALNLDGGTSTGLHLAEPEMIIPAFTRLPIVILVNSKE